MRGARVRHGAAASPEPPFTHTHMGAADVGVVYVVSEHDDAVTLRLVWPALAFGAPGYDYRERIDARDAVRRAFDDALAALARLREA